ncbi:hypothetical protein SAY87_029117 [Trapa incisa]|uniref:J domain-containing protein n=1 Tax=Trapa incisa TaxID=236973 RepID=A0AAN7L0Z7_9MYRT|nr:hypothetical protein SAY87_029117 [Trapa incisa]
MKGGREKSEDFYAVLGLKKECSAAELKDAYRKLAKRWHPDRCSASGNLKAVEESKEKFQAIQHAYSVLSDENKRFLYDVGVYESDDDESGMGDFLNEMAVMMSQNDSNGNGEESLEDLQELFHEMFQGDMEALASTSQTLFMEDNVCSAAFSSSNKRNCAQMGGGGDGDESSSAFRCLLQDFSLGTDGAAATRTQEAKRGNRRRNSRTQHRP